MTADDIYTIAGSSTGSSGYTGNGGAATSAKLDVPAGLAFDSSGDLYIARHLTTVKSGRSPHQLAHRGASR